MWQKADCAAVAGKPHWLSADRHTAHDLAV
jgi:hypothetical protein